MASENEFDRERWKRERDARRAFERSYFQNMRLSGTEGPDGSVEIESKTASEWSVELNSIPLNVDLTDVTPQILRPWFLQAGQNHSLATIMMSHAKAKAEILEGRQKVAFAEACRSFRDSFKQGGSRHDPARPKARPTVANVEEHGTIATQDLTAMIRRFRLEHDFFVAQAKTIEKCMTALKAALDAYHNDPTNRYGYR